jgi:abequosyltransferase
MTPQARDDFRPVLSICIASMRRPAELKAQLERIVEQLDAFQGDLLEVVVVDGSPLDLQTVFHHPRVRVLYETPSGIDRDYDLAVRNSVGEFCWLLPDDDLIESSAIALIFDVLERGSKDELSLVLLNAIVRDLNGKLLAPSIQPSGLPDHFQAPVMPITLWSVASTLNYIGSVVVRRDLWNCREPSKYFGSEFVHVGVLLSEGLPGACAVIHEPIITIVYGRAHWEKRAALVWLSQWPTLISSLNTIPISAQPSHCSLRGLIVDALHFRALGSLTKKVVSQVNQDGVYTRKHLLTIRLIAALPTTFCLAVMQGLIRVFPARIDSLKSYNVRTQVQDLCSEKKNVEESFPTIDESSSA